VEGKGLEFSGGARNDPGVRNHPGGSNLPPTPKAKAPPPPRVQQSTLNPRELKASQRHLKTTYPMLGFGGDEISFPSTQTTRPSCSLFVFSANMNSLKCSHQADLKRPHNTVSALSCLGSGGWCFKVHLYRGLKITSYVPLILTVEELHSVSQVFLTLYIW